MYLRILIKTIIIIIIIIISKIKKVNTEIFLVGLKPSEPPCSALPVYNVMLLHCLLVIVIVFFILIKMYIRETSLRSKALFLVGEARGREGEGNYCLL